MDAALPLLRAPGAGRVVRGGVRGGAGGGAGVHGGGERGGAVPPHGRAGVTVRTAVPVAAPRGGGSGGGRVRRGRCVGRGGKHAREAPHPPRVVGHGVPESDHGAGRRGRRVRSHLHPIPELPRERAGGRGRLPRGGAQVPQERRVAQRRRVAVPWLRALRVLSRSEGGAAGAQGRGLPAHHHRFPRGDALGHARPGTSLPSRGQCLRRPDRRHASPARLRGDARRAGGPALGRGSRLRDAHRLLLQGAVPRGACAAGVVSRLCRASVGGGSDTRQSAGGGYTGEHVRAGAGARAAHGSAVAAAGLSGLGSGSLHRGEAEGAGGVLVTPAVGVP